MDLADQALTTSCVTRQGKPGPGEQAGQGLLDEVAARVRGMREADRTVVPPLLLLGVMERVGSNWVSDTLRPVTGQHNEPFRQQLSPGHPLSARNPDVMRPAEAGNGLGGYGQHWLVSFAAGKYARERQVVKETNLFFAVPALLALFPESPVIVLARSPLGIASSFARSDLFRRWGYRGRYRQMTQTTRRPGFGRWAAVVPDDDPPDLAALARLQVLNTLILAEALQERDRVAVICYETAVLDPDTARGTLAGVIPEAPGLGIPGGAPSQAGESLFATTAGKTGLAAGLTDAEAGTVREAAASALTAGRRAVSGPAWDQARDWAGGGQLYALSPRRAAGQTSARRPPVAGPAGPVCWVPGRASPGLAWRNLLVTNDEFAAFLNEMAAAGLPNCVDGSYLFACEMPHERGGRLHSGSRDGRWTVSRGFGSHPVYWVTWIGAACLAARHGARLPARAELDAETAYSDVRVTNCGYQAGDTVPVTEPGREPGELHHLAGNVQVWCADGPAVPGYGPVTRWLHGAAWNTPGTPGEISRLRSRHLPGASRGVGIRLVRDQASQPPATAAQLAAVLRGWAVLLADRSKPLGLLDQALISALGTLSQPDSGLRSHVGAGTGEPGDG